MQTVKASLIDLANNDKAFSPRYIDPTIPLPTQGNDRRDFAFLEMDEYEQIIRVYNLSQRHLNVAFRDGSKLSLREIDIDTMKYARCYGKPRASRGGRRGKRPIIYDQRDMRENYNSSIPDFQAGLYIVVERTLSTPSSYAGQSQLVYDNFQDADIRKVDNVQQMCKSNIPQSADRVLLNPVTENDYDGPNHFTDEQCYQGRGRDGVTKRRFNESYIFDYFVSIEEIERCTDEGLYIEQFDLYVSHYTGFKQLTHPFSEEGLLKRSKSFTEDVYKDKGAIKVGQFSIVNIDNSSETSVPSYYVNCDGMILRVDPIYHPTLKAGVHVHYKNIVDHDSGELLSGETFLTHQEVFHHAYKNIPHFYRSQKDALTLGDMLEKEKAAEKEREFQRNKELSEMRAQAELMKLERDEIKARNDAEVTRIKQESDLKILQEKQKYDERALELKEEDAKRVARIAEMKAELEQRKLHMEELKMERDRAKAALEEELARKKAYYDERSYDRKDSSDTLKWVLTSVGTVVSLAVLILK